MKPIASPYTGQEMPVKSREQAITFRGKQFTAPRYYYLCETTGEEFTTAELDEMNLQEIYSGAIPDPDLISA
ncbi:hypothetical protein [Telluribacter sp. SYSU D00476]|uniref:hypothetical protein n=1 Tax=Telluribacter sp. SYSU D00476 TaxID=2811430 RepID=UPI001FF5AB8E|nr:hypothetical protein [Telluribacter sp. SYSU D00476]